MQIKQYGNSYYLVYDLIKISLEVWGKNETKNFEGTAELGSIINNAFQSVVIKPHYDRYKETYPLWYEKYPPSFPCCWIKKF